MSVTDTIDGEQKGIESFNYDDKNRVITITQTGNGVTDKRVDYSYDAASQMTEVSRYWDLSGTNLIAKSVYSYDEAGRLTQLIHQQNSEIIAQYNWVYDEANRIVKVTNPDGVTDYNYDDIDQLINVSFDYQNDESYSYDKNGNRVSSSFPGSEYQTGINNRLLSDGIDNYEYDNEGNLIKKITVSTGEVTQYEWDFRNRLVKVITKNIDGNIIANSEYIYDVYDRRIAKLVDVDADGEGELIAQVEHFVNDGAHIALTFDGEGNLQERFLHGVEIDEVIAQENENGEVIWGLGDNQGTIRDVIDNNGEVVNHITYDGFGQVTGETDEDVEFRFSYTGRELDEETELYYYRARYYNANTGRFVSEDPIGFAGGDANLYRYVGNSPTNFIDPSGNIAIPFALGVGGGLLAGAGAILTAPVSAPVAVVAIAGSAVIGGAIGLYNNRQNNIDSLPDNYFPSNPPPFPNNNNSSPNVERLIPPNVETGTKPFPGNIDNSRPQVETFPGNSCPADFSPRFLESSHKDITPESVLEDLSKNNLKHTQKHLPEFQNLDPNITANSLRELGASIVKPENLISQPDSSQKVFEQIIRPLAKVFCDIIRGFSFFLLATMKQRSPQ